VRTQAATTALERDLADLPVKDGFRLRGVEITRIETFTDAAFAFAVTLLVISIDAVPASYAELLDAIEGIPAFLFSFVMLMVFWHGHWTWSRRFGLDDMPTIVLSLALVFIVLCYVYPLKYLSSLILFWITRGGISDGASLESIEQLYSIFAIYGAGFIAMAGAIILLNLHAWRLREALALNDLERFDTRAEIGAWSVLAGVGAFSVLLALLTPPSGVVAPGWAYMLLPVVMPAFGVTANRRRRAILARGPASVAAGALG
jgi:hypothetical protein